MKNYNQVKLYNVWYASYERSNSTGVSLAYDAKGELTLDFISNNFNFKSDSFNVNAKELLNVEYVNQKFAWKGWITVLGAIITFFYFTSGSLLYPVVMSFSGALIGIIVYQMFRWIRITFYDDKGEQQILYFADGDWNGYSGLFGGNIKLFKLFNRLIEVQQLTQKQPF